MTEQHSISKLPSPANEETLLLLSELHKYPHITQRELSEKFNISLGKTNYLIKELLKKGILKMKRFSRNRGRLRKVKYYLTKKGLEEKLRLTYVFLQKKEAEYNQIKKAWEDLINSNKRGLDKFIEKDKGKEVVLKD